MTWLAAARALTAAALAAGVLAGLPTGASAGSAPAAAPRAAPQGDLPRLTAELERVTAHAQLMADRLDQAAARDGGLRVAYARLEDARYDAQLALDRRASEVYKATRPAPVGNWQAELASPGLRRLAHRGTAAALTIDQELVDAVTAQAAKLKAMERQADAFRRSLLAGAQAVFADQDRARLLLAEAVRIAQAQQAAAVLARLEAQRETLDQVSAEVTVALTPAQTRRSRRAAEQQAPVVALIEASGSAIPQGYRLSGVSFSGEASWYGPGFVGKPTASGAPYDPERPTCAHKTLPLGTVVHVTRGALAITCLVNDRGPFVGDRIIDLSRAGSRGLGFSGVAQVTVHVLAPA